MNETARPVLGLAPGVYREVPVLPALRPHFSALWFHEAPADGSGRSAIVPDGAADLVWFAGCLSVAGPQRQARVEAVPPGAIVIGLRFRPGAAAPWLGVPLTEVAGVRLPLEAFWGSAAHHGLADRMLAADKPQAAARLLQAGLAGRQPAAAAPDALAEAVFALLDQAPDPSLPVLDMLTAELGVSPRTLRRRCLEAFGFGPKTLARILRFQRFLDLLRREPGGLADLAAAAGYADQSHLSRETLDLAGLTLRPLRDQLAIGRAAARAGG